MSADERDDARRLGLAFGIVFLLVVVCVAVLLGHVFTRW